MHPVFSTFKHGKLLLSGEYAVLDGATALALPVRYGQRLSVHEAASKQPVLYWESQNDHGEIWFKAQFDLPDLQLVSASDDEAGLRLQQLLISCKKENPAFLNTAAALRVVTSINFPRAWGLGTSSTLVAAVAQWANVDPYIVLEASFGGSGYDVACANADGPILYRRFQSPRAERIHFLPDFADQLYFVYLGQKQDSREGIKSYRARPEAAAKLQPEINQLTAAMVEAKTLTSFGQLMSAHEQCIVDALGLEPVQRRLFSDFEGAVKSLGAWGGDFVLAASKSPHDRVVSYFSDKGFNTCIPYLDMVIQRQNPQIDRISQ